MWWSLLQGTIFFLVIAASIYAASIHAEWASLDGRLPTALGVMLAYGVTWSLSRLSDWYAKRKHRGIRGQERLEKERNLIR
jgi:hypothetical protein